MNDAYFTPKQAAAKLGIDEASVRRMCREGRLPAQRIRWGVREVWRISIAAVEEAAELSQLPAAPPPAAPVITEGGIWAKQPDGPWLRYDPTTRGWQPGEPPRTFA